MLEFSVCHYSARVHHLRSGRAQSRCRACCRISGADHKGTDCARLTPTNPTIRLHFSIAMKRIWLPHIEACMVLLAILVLVSLVDSSLGAESSQLVTGLPGQPQVQFKQYAGHITVNTSAGRALFYWFYEANQSNQSSLPLAIWFNGGPGCSSIGNGALSELGPFRTKDDGTGLVFNEFSWTQAANVIFLESPHGVGFSYSNTTSDYDVFSDNQTAADVLVFILEWLKRFPEYSKNDFYLTGESYAGHYVPTLAAKILEFNKKGVSSINFKGFAIGNPWTDAYYDNKGDTEFWHSHSLISDETYDQLMQHCDFANDLPVDSGSSNPNCQAAAHLASEDIEQIDIYNIYALSCNVEGKSARPKFLHREMLAAAYDPCLNSVSPYLNLDAVQEALHVSARPTRWSSCSRAPNRNYLRQDIVASMLPLYRELVKSGLKIWIYSGDVDGVVATTATRSWIKQLNLTVNTPWYAWNFQSQVGGWTQIYSGLTFTTVRGAGHMVPADKPEQALQVFKHFLEGKPLPSF